MGDRRGYVLISGGLVAVVVLAMGCGAEPALRPGGAQGAASPVVEPEGGSAGTARGSAKTPIGGATEAGSAGAAPAGEASGTEAEYELSRPVNLGGSGLGPPSARVSLGRPSVSGSPAAGSIERVVRARYGHLRSCYERALLRNPKLAGRVSVRFSISGEGVPDRVTGSGSEIRDEGLVGCVVRAFESLPFPAPEDGTVTVVYPIRFHLPRLPVQYEASPVQAPPK